MARKAFVRSWRTEREWEVRNRRSRMRIGTRRGGAPRSVIARGLQSNDVVTLGRNIYRSSSGAVDRPAIEASSWRNGPRPRGHLPAGLGAVLDVSLLWIRYERSDHNRLSAFHRLLELGGGRSERIAVRMGIATFPGRWRTVANVVFGPPSCGRAAVDRSEGAAKGTGIRKPAFVGHTFELQVRLAHQAPGRFEA